MRFDILTILPELLDGPFNVSLMKRAQERGIIEIHLHNIRDYATNKHKNVDDYQYGGGAGMVMMIEPIAAVIEKLKAERNYDEIIYMTPDGELFEQKHANQFSMGENIMILCGHYKGVDERIREHYITKEISIGSYVLTGGEIAACVVVDAISRLIPGVMNDETSALTDSFQDSLLSPPVYTRPPEYNGWKVPDILISGNFAKIDLWREEQAIERTKTRRPDLYKKFMNEE
ncbi:MAG: tRNA (guanosine(37)-N1)-methyltransferase TrmD [Fluviicola sp.]|jgi:tRNA (guanine37-N1)-methyltransferase